MEADGAFIAGLPEIWRNKLVQVKKRTWGGYGGAVTSETTAKADNTIIETHDWMFIPSDAEQFGNNDRYATYSKYE